MSLSLEVLDGIGPVYGPAGAPGLRRALPGVVVVHGAEGAGAGWSHRFAAILAAHGVLALPVSYGAGDIFGAGTIRDVDLASIPSAGLALASHPSCGGAVGLFGWSKGAEAALLVASLAPGPFSCVAAHAPPAVVTGAFDPAAFRAGEAGARAPGAARAWVWEGHGAALAPGTPIAVERAPVPVFLSSGTEDEVIDHSEMQALAARLAQAGRPADVFVAEGQGHGLDFAVEPELWARLLAFFGRHLRAAA